VSDHESKLDLNLSALVTAIRDELETMDRQRRSQTRPALLQLAAMELELNFVITRKAGAEGKLDFKVLAIGASIGADAGVESEKVQKIRLTFSLADTRTPDAEAPVGSRFHSSSARQAGRRNIEPL
jgi:Trypsin-co-occurring domain 2